MAARGISRATKLLSATTLVTHTVSAKGMVSNVTMHNMKEEAKDAAASAGMKKTNDEHGDLDVESLKMVSKSCK
jgi:hypothetical protein